MTLTKVQLRKIYRDKCHHVTAAYRLEAAQAAARLFVQQDNFIQSQHIACYLSFKSEFDSAPLIEAIWQAKKYCYVPVLAEGGNSVLHFVRYHYGDTLRLNRYSILEPADKSKQLKAEALDLVVVPLIAFDAKGHRLGAGGGYYDRSFAFVREQKIAKPQLVGLGYAEQQADVIPDDPWDIRLTSIVTEKSII